MTTQWLAGWWNLIFVLPFGIGLLYLGIYTLSGWTLGDTDADLDHDLDADADADADVDADADADVNHDLSHDADSDADARDADGDADQASPVMTALCWLGVGKLPLSLLMMVMLLSWGIAGFTANRLQIDRPLEWSLPLSIAIAMVAAVGMGRVVSGTIARFFPTNETSARRRHELIGTAGEAVYPIDSTFGMVCGRDEGGQWFEVACRTAADATPIAKGAAVRLVGYCARERMFYVASAEGVASTR